MANTTDKRRQNTLPEPDDKPTFERLKETASRTKDTSGVWLREDGAVCFGDECVVLSKEKSGAINFEVNPTACGRETGKVVMDFLVENLASGEPINIKVRAQEKKSLSGRLRRDEL